MKIFFLLTTLAALISCSHFTERTPSSDSKPRHLIITVHGLSGNAATFGAFKEITEKYMSDMTPGYNTKIVDFVYPTGQDEKNGAYEFAFGPQGLSQFVKKQFADRALRPEDKISFVCHSQGGLISYIWFFRSILENQTEDYKYVQNVDSIITLGTPFWGSKISSILLDKNNISIIPLIKALAPAAFKMTRHEIADMAYSSDTLNTLRTMAVALDNNPALNDIIQKLPVRLINISGILPADKNALFSRTSNQGAAVSDLTKKIINLVYSIYSSSYSSFKDNRKESDVAVPIPSSRWNFIYTNPKKIKKDQKETIISQSEYNNFSRMVGKSEFIFTESIHLPFADENTLSMAYINKACKNVDDCDHPTYRYILDQLVDRCRNRAYCNFDKYTSIVQTMKEQNKSQQESFEKLGSDLDSFSVQVNIKLPKGTLDSFPVEYQGKRSNPEADFFGYDYWEVNENTLVPKIVDFHIDKKSLSKFSTKDYQIFLADKSEVRSLDIVSKRAEGQDDHDKLRIHVTGRIVDDRSVRNRPKYYVAPITLRIPGLPIVKINAHVEPTYSTFTELDYTE